jgi:ribosome maturation factor RimP
MEVERVVRPVVEAAGLEFVDASIARDQGRRILRITVDREGGVDLDAISEVSQRISRRLDLERFDPGPYQLEVSSPGVERPLRGARDFARHVGARVKVKTAEPVEGTRTHTGTVLEAGTESVRIATDEGERIVSYDEMTSARTVFEWDAKGGRP